MIFVVFRNVCDEISSLQPLDFKSQPDEHGRFKVDALNVYLRAVATAMLLGASKYALFVSVYICLSL